jgi:hypothetical protein
MSKHPDYPGYKKTEKDGVVHYERVLPFAKVTYEKPHPHIHFHYLLSDEEANKLDEIRAELCCHGCGKSRVLMGVLPQVIPDGGVPWAAEERRLFVEAHKDCKFDGGAVGGVLAGTLGMALGAFACPVARTDVAIIDRRKETP